MNKIFLFLACMATQTNIQASQVVQAKVKHIFEQLEHEKFVDSMTNFLLQTKAGRNFLLRWRVAEINRETTASVIVENHLSVANFTYLASSLLYEDSKKKESFLMHTVYSPMTKQGSRSTKTIIQMIDAIAALEAILIEPKRTHLSSLHQTAFERTRVHDLYLVKLILENNNHDYIKATDVYVLPNILSATHRQWPPEQYKDIVHPTSAYTVIKEALETRKARNIDAINEDENVERYSCQIIEAPKQNQTANTQQLTEQQEKEAADTLHNMMHNHAVTVIEQDLP